MVWDTRLRFHYRRLGLEKEKTGRRKRTLPTEHHLNLEQEVGLRRAVYYPHIRDI